MMSVVNAARLTARRIGIGGTIVVLMGWPRWSVWKGSQDGTTWMRRSDTKGQVVTASHHLTSVKWQIDSCNVEIINHVKFFNKKKCISYIKKKKKELACTWEKKLRWKGFRQRRSKTVADLPQDQLASLKMCPRWEQWGRVSVHVQRMKNRRKAQTQSEATDRVKSAGDCVILLLNGCHILPGSWVWIHEWMS